MKFLLLFFGFYTLKAQIISVDHKGNVGYFKDIENCNYTTLKTFEDIIFYAVALSPDGKLYAVVKDNTLVEVDIKRNKIDTLGNFYKSVVVSLHCDSNGHLIGSTRDIEYFNLNTMQFSNLIGNLSSFTVSGGSINLEEDSAIMLCPTNPLIHGLTSETEFRTNYNMYLDLDVDNSGGRFINHYEVDTFCIRQISLADRDVFLDKSRRYDLDSIVVQIENQGLPIAEQIHIGDLPSSIRVSQTAGKRIVLYPIGRPFTWDYEAAIRTLYYDFSQTETAVVEREVTFTMELRVFPRKVTFIDTLLKKGDSFLVGTDVYTEPGTYIVDLTSRDGCDSIVHLVLDISISTTALTSVSYEARLQPNPTYENTSNLVLSTLRKERIQLKLFDVTGRLLTEQAQEVAAGQTTIALDLSAVSGTYWLQVLNESGQMQLLKGLRL